MAIFGFFEDKKAKEELKAAKERIALLEKQLEEKTKENEELKNLINVYSNSEVEKTKGSKSQNKTMSASEKAESVINDINAVKSENSDKPKHKVRKTKKTEKKKSTGKKATQAKTMSGNEKELAKSVNEVEKNISEKPKRRGRKPKNKVDNTTPLKKNAKTPIGDDGKPKSSKKVNGATKRGRKKKDANAKASASNIKDEEVLAKAENTAEPLEAAVMGIDEYENYDAIKPSKPASKPKRKYTRRKLVSEGKADAKVSKTKKTNRSVKAVKPDKIESYADMLAITQTGENKR